MRQQFQPIGQKQNRILVRKFRLPRFARYESKSHKTKGSTPPPYYSSKRPDLDERMSFQTQTPCSCMHTTYLRPNVL